MVPRPVYGEVRARQRKCGYTDRLLALIWDSGFLTAHQERKAFRLYSRVMTGETPNICSDQGICIVCSEMDSKYGRLRQLFSREYKSEDTITLSQFVC